MITVVIMSRTGVSLPSGETSVELPALCKSMKDMLEKLKNVDVVCRDVAQGHVNTISRPLLCVNKDDGKKWFAFHSLAEQISDTLVHDGAMRQEILATSADWKTGKYL